MRWLHTHREILFLWLLFLFSRILFLGRLPIFNDEAIIISLSRVVFINPSHWILLTLDGRQPLFGLTIALGTLLPVAPLIGARLAMVAWSLVTFGASLALARDVGLTARALRFYALSLIVTPYLLFYDRMALAESPIVALSMLAVLVTIKIIRRPSVLMGIILGAIFGIGWWYFSLILLVVPSMLILLIFYGIRNRARRWPMVRTMIASGIMFVGIVLPVLTQEHYWRVVAESPQRFFSVRQLLSFPIAAWTQTVSDILQWTVAYTSLPVILLASLGSIAFFSSFGIRVALTMTIVPLLLSALFVTTVSARNLVVFVPFYLLLGAFGIQKSNIVSTVLGWSALGVMAVTSEVLIVSPPLYYRTLGYIPAAQRDFYQYVGGWTSGYGVAEAAVYLTEIAQTGDSIVVTRFDSGNPEDGIRVLLQNPRIRIAYLSQLKTILPEWDRAGRRQRMYFVSRGSAIAGLEPYVTPLVKFKKPVGDEYVGVYQFRWD